MPYVENDIRIENARIIFRNFSGKKSTYNEEGDRNFNVIIPDEQMALRLTDDGWNIHVREPRDEGDKPEYRLPVAVNFKYKPPKVVMITGRKRTILTEETVKILDQADIAHCDIIIHPYNWTKKERDGRIVTGVKAYLKTLYAVLEEDEFEAKYAYDEAPDEVPF